MARKTTWRDRASATTAVAPGTRSGAIADWNRIALDAAVSASRSPGEALHALALVHAAMFEALNSVELRYRTRYAVHWDTQPKRSPEAIAAAAAHYVLAELYPARAAVLDRAFRETLDAIEDRQAAHAGTIVGISVAQLVWAVRARESRSPGRRGARLSPKQVGSVRRLS